MVKLIIEHVEEPAETIVEANADGGKSYWIQGIFLQANVKNKNGRVYPHDTMRRSAEQYVTEYVNTRRAISELGHPENPIVNLDRVSHLITELKEEGSNWVGKAKILGSLPYGKIAEGFIKEGVKLGVSSRGMGSLVLQNGVNTVQGDYKIVAVDLVWDPSAPAALVTGLMEGAEWVFDSLSGDYRLLEEIRNEVHSAPKFNEEVVLKAFEKLMSSFN